MVERQAGAYADFQNPIAGATVHLAYRDFAALLENGTEKAVVLPRQAAIRSDDGLLIHEYVSRELKP